MDSGSYEATHKTTTRQFYNFRTSRLVDIQKVVFDLKLLCITRITSHKMLLNKHTLYYFKKKVVIPKPAAWLKV